ncbi:LYR motif-containing protein 2 [Exaiptasia diaphana]|uniref:LYR motif-containing protein 2 n=1 Tax=Exaiptasia diaphana TaxID=2652724 RepID=A0A913XJX8_EXADI|nr:LYR motif-containing protein 2 [Exaiptasia diaphana]KXJ11377.1 LYR motif-containing protein 2 [Exaiptasia diaphana]
MAARLPPNTLTLKQFLVRRQVLSLYREIMKTIKQIENPEYQKELRNWTRDEFKQNKGTQDQDAIQNMIYRGQQTLKELSVTIAMAR